MRIATYNVYGWRGWPAERAETSLGRPGSPPSIEYFRRILADLGCDVFVLQECASEAVVDALAAAAGKRCVVFPSPCRWPAAVLSGGPLLEPRSLAPATADFQADPLSRAAGSVRVRLDGEREATLVAVHLHPMDVAIRRIEASFVIREVEAGLRRSAGVVVLGDFNGGPEEALHEELRRYRFVNAMQACGGGMRPTRDVEPGKEPCVDHVYVSESLAGLLESAEVLDRPPYALDSRDPTAWACSDHFPVVVELELEPGAISRCA
jgi:endonuclease/exonuclease/phosphatase (EEP) superfamily protein YafD